MSSVTAAGRTVEVLRHGAGAPLLYLHGLADVHSVFAPADLTALVDALAAEREVIAPAHPGYLGSDALDAGADVEDHAFHLVDLLDALGLDTVDVVGCSFGGWLAAELALRHPARIGRLALIAPLGLHVPGEPGALFFGAVAPRGVGGYGEVRGVLFADPDSAVALGAFPDQPGRDDMLRWFTGLSGAAQIGWTAPQLADPKLAGRLRRIPALALVVAGAKDRIVPATHTQRWQQELPDARLEIVDDAAHCVQLEQPDAVARLVLDFLG
jgi:pimeloyl-ACP methyl ester carboxylesterase